MGNSFILSKQEFFVVNTIKISLGLLLFWTALGAFFTSMNSVLLELKDIDTNWFYLSLNYFSRAWVWLLLTPIIYHLYRRLYAADILISGKFIISTIFGLTIAIIHVFGSLHFDVLLRNYLNIIEVNFWEMISSEMALIIRFLFNSFITYILLITCFISNDHFGFIKKFTAKGQQIRTKAASNSTNILSYWESVITKSGGSNELQNSFSEKLIVKSKGKILFLHPSEIRCVESRGNYVLIVLNGKQVVARATLKAMEARLSSFQFFRINRSVIVNRNFIKELEHCFNGEYVVRMTEERQFKSGRTYKNQIRRLLNKNILR